MHLHLKSFCFNDRFTVCTNRLWRKGGAEVCCLDSRKYPFSEPAIFDAQDENDHRGAGRN